MRRVSYAIKVIINLSYVLTCEVECKSPVESGGVTFIM